MKKFLYWLSTFTWGIIGTIAGFFVFLFFKCLKKPTKMYKGAFATTFETNMCLSVGPFTFVNGEGTWINNHEFGHCIQNAMYGPLVLILVYIPSMITANMKCHNDMWYEKQATKLGERKW